MLNTWLVFLLTLALLWLGSGLVVGAVNRVAARLHLSVFALSFTVLGLLTSIPEFSVGLNAVFEDRPNIFIGNLLGASAVLFFLIIPLLAVLGNGVKLNGGFQAKQLGLALAVIFAPAILVVDGRLSLVEGVVLLMLYAFLILVLPSDQNLLARIKAGLNRRILSHSLVDVTRLLLGIGLVFVASHYLVEETVALSVRLQIPVLVVSLFALSIGTNIPELALGARSILTRRKDVAFGDYLGSAATNTLFFGFFTILAGRDLTLPSGIWRTVIIAGIGYVLFWFLATSKHSLSRREGLIMLLIYFAFLGAQFLP